MLYESVLSRSILPLPLPLEYLIKEGQRKISSVPSKYFEHAATDTRMPQTRP